MTGAFRKTTDVARVLAFGLFLLPFASPCAHGASGLWAGENLLLGPAIRPGDTVTIVLERRSGPCMRVRHERAAPCSKSAKGDKGEAACGRCASKSAVSELAARVVKVLPNGNIVLEVRLRIGAGSILLGGEAARMDVCAVDRTVAISRLTNLAVVARGIDDGILGGILALARGARVARAGTKKTTR